MLCFIYYNHQTNFLLVNCLFLRALVVVVVFLTFLGASPVEPPLVFMRQGATFVYLFLFVGFSFL